MSGSHAVPLRIGLNLLHARPEIGGGWNYIQHLLIGLAEVDSLNHYICYATDESLALIPRNARFETRQIARDFRSRFRRVLYENVWLPTVARRDNLDMLHWFANTGATSAGIPGLVTVHDLLVFKQPGAFAVAQRIYMQIWMRHTVDHAAKLLPVSEFTAQDLREMLGAQSNRMSVVYAALPDHFRPPTPEMVARVRQEYQLPDKFWLYVAQAYPHKNHAALLDAYAVLRKRIANPWPLVLRGDFSERLDVIDKVQQLGLTECVKILGRLQHEEMPALYGAASALIFPSLFEGGGIPVLEALACGCPVAASDLPSLHEYGADAIHYFDATNEFAIVDTLEALQGDSKRLDVLARAGLERADAFRTRNVACKMLQIYQEVGVRTR